MSKIRLNECLTVSNTATLDSLYSKRLVVGENPSFFPRGSTLKLNAKILEDELQHHGSQVEEIAFSFRCLGEFNEGTLTWALEYCPKIKSVNAVNMRLDQNDWAACKSLESLNVSYLAEQTEAKMRAWIAENKNLRRLTVDRATWFTHRCLYDLTPGQLECLRVKLCKNFRLSKRLTRLLADSIVEFEYAPDFKGNLGLGYVTKMRNLRDLDLNVRSSQLRWKLIGTIANNCPNLERLHLGYFSEDVMMDDDLKLLMNLTKLRRVVIRPMKSVITNCGFINLLKELPDIVVFTLCVCYASYGGCERNLNNCKVYKIKKMRFK